MTGLPAPELVAAGRRRHVAAALTATEVLDSVEVASFLDAALAAGAGHVVGLTGPPGVGKSTLANALVGAWRSAGDRVGVIAVDPSSRATGGALLGDRTRIRKDPEDEGVFVRSMAARDRLGGLSEHTLAAMVVMRLAFGRVLIESVGIGQSEADIAFAAETVVLCIQPGSGDSLQFMKAGIMELPHILAITKADTGPAARRAVADVEGALGLSGPRPDGWRPIVLAVSAQTGDGVAALSAAIETHRRWLAEGSRAGWLRAAQARAWVEDAVRGRFGTAGLQAVAADLAGLDPTRPFSGRRALLERLSARLGIGPAGRGDPRAPIA
jgi:LAO/AO transport system kinase